MKPTIPAALLVLLLSTPLASEEVQPAEDAPRPSPSEESVKFFRLPEGFRIELVASEPLISDPSGIAWDENGRLFVSELHGYNLEGHLDVQALNKTGVLDRKVRRIPAGEEAREAAAKETYGTVKQLEDIDGDGRMDRAHVWADRLPPCYGLIASRGGVIVACAPDIYFLADRDGDGKAEVREKLFTGFGTGALERGINTPRLGLDNWIYFGRGRGGKIRGPGLESPVSIGSTDLRIRPDGSSVEPVTGGSGTFGIAFTEFGDRFLITGGNHAYYAIPLPYRYLLRNPYVASPGTDAGASGYARIYPISKPHPWRLKRSQDPAWVRFYGQREATASGYFTSACSPIFYDADAFPPEYRGNHFSCEPQNNIVHRCLVERDGAGYRVQRAPEEQDREFLASTEKWFRPNSLAIGPDGALHIVDMYREIIEDYSAIPRFLQQQYGLARGNEHGRIWRVVHESAPEATRPQLGKASSEGLAELIAHPNVWWRETARRILIERGDKTPAPILSKTVRTANTAQARLNALAALEGLGALLAADVQHALADTNWGVRRFALRLADSFIREDEAVLRSVLALQRDPDPAVRLQLALTLGESRSPSALDALVFLAASFGNERWMETAIASSAAETAPELLARLLRRRDGVGSARSVVDLLSQTIGARQRPEEVAGFLETLADLDESPAPPLNLEAECLRGLAKGLRRGKSVRLDDAGGMRALTRLLASSRAPVRTAAFEVVGGLELADASFLREVFERSAREASDASLEVEPRLAALRLLAHAPFASRRATCKELLQPRHAVDLQLAAVAALSDADDAVVGELLLSGWRGYSPRVREAVLDAIFARQNRLPHLLTALESELIETGTVTSFRRTRLLESDDEELGRRARAVFDDRSRTRFVNDETFERFAAALGGEHDLVRGGQLFEEHCASCHRAGEKGHAVGPDLASERERADETLLNDMLAPSSQITAGYSAYIAITTDGRALTGVLTSESATSLTLRQAKAVEETVLRKNIRTLSVSSVSLMPENFAELFKPEDAADIIAYLRSTFGDVLPVSVTLFDEEEDFVDRLDSGDGVARIVTDDVHSGKHALTVTPLQRHSPRIPNWDYRIAEKPRPGEYRYLRLAWKTTGGDGVLIELAASGGWPPAESATRRYYSGANTTKWGAHEVSKKVPTEWTVVTVDLWKDNGAFTLTGIAPTACGGVAHFDRIELLRRP